MFAEQTAQTEDCAEESQKGTCAAADEKRCADQLGPLLGDSGQRAQADAEDQRGGGNSQPEAGVAECIGVSFFGHVFSFGKKERDRRANGGRGGDQGAGVGCVTGIAVPLLVLIKYEPIHTARPNASKIKAWRMIHPDMV